mgnify:CR=1 FL=1
MGSVESMKMSQLSEAFSLTGDESIEVTEIVVKKLDATSTKLRARSRRMAFKQFLVRDGENGKDVLQLARAQGFIGTLEMWLEANKGKPGKNGQPGKRGPIGKGVYALAVEGGFTGTEEEWWASLKGVGEDPPDNQKFYTRSFERWDESPFTKNVEGKFVFDASRFVQY